MYQNQPRARCGGSALNPCHVLSRGFSFHFFVAKRGYRSGFPLLDPMRSVCEMTAQLGVPMGPKGSRNLAGSQCPDGQGPGTLRLSSFRPHGENRMRGGGLDPTRFWHAFLLAMNQGRYSWFLAFFFPRVGGNHPGTPPNNQSSHQVLGSCFGVFPFSILESLKGPSLRLPAKPQRAPSNPRKP